MQAEVSSEQAEALSRDLNLRFYRACVKDNLNVAEGMPWRNPLLFSARLAVLGFCVVAHEHSDRMCCICMRVQAVLLVSFQCCALSKAMPTHLAIAK